MKRSLSLACGTGIPYVFILTFATLLFSSCTKTGDPQAGGLTGGESQVKITLSAGSFAGTPMDGGEMEEKSTTETSTTVTTKAIPATMHEDDMADMWVVQFDAGGACVRSQYFSTYDPADFVVTLANGTAQTVAFTANTFDANLFKNYAGNWSAFQAVVKTVAENTLYTGTAPNNYLIISGIYKGNITAAGLPAAVQMKRAVAKVNFAWSVAVPAADGFTATNIRLCQVPNKQAYLEPAGNTYPAWSTATINDTITYPVLTNPAAGTISWYLTENARGTGTGKTSFDKNDLTAPEGQAAYCTYIDVQGTYTFNKAASDGSKKTATLSYKFYLGADMISDYNVRRNNIYNLKVRITGANAADARIWVKDAGSLGTGDGWEDPTDPDQDFNFGLMPAANCFMVIPGEKAVFDARIQGNGGTGAVAMSPASVAVLWQTGDGVTPLIKSVALSNGLVTLTPTAGTTGNAVVVARNASNTVLWSWHIWVTDYKPTSQVAVAANTAYGVTGGQVHTYGTAFMTANPGKVIMDRNLGAAKAIYSNNPSVADGTASFGLFYQWGRKDPFPAWDGVGDNPATPTTQKLYAADGTTAADGNYKNVAGPVSVATAIANPGNFYYAAATPYDWTTPQNDALWGTGAKKSIYDPCPKGWRVAPDKTWTDFTRAAAAPWTTGTFIYYSKGVIAEATAVYTATNGRYYAPNANLKVWYPAPGYRINSSGALTYVGNEGSVWSRSFSGTYGQYLGFYSTNLNPSSANGRAYGFQVRCVQE